jgi:Glucodextranase, domain B
MRSRSAVLALAVCMAGFLVGAAPAFATVTSSNVTVTSPTGTYLLDNQVTPSETITVTGTSNGTAGTDSVDINCYYGTNNFRNLATSVSVGTGGTFSYSGSLASISGETCVLRAVNHGDTADHPPGSPSTFTGPTLAISSLENDTVSGGPENGDLEDYELLHPQLAGDFDLYSLGDCSIVSGVRDPSTFAYTSFFDCDGWFWWENGQSEAGFMTATRSELQVDGADAFVAGNADSVSTMIPGYPSISYTDSIDPATGNLVVNETDQVVKCSPGGAFPPTPSSCTSFVPTGVQVQMRITTSQNGRGATVTHYFSSTDGHSHSLDLLEDNEFDNPDADGEINFPWTGSGMSPYTTVGQVVPGPSAPGPGSFFARGSASVADGSELAAVGAVTFSNPPSSETIIGTTNDSEKFSWVDLHYTRTVPAAGSVALGFTYADSFTLSDVTSSAPAAAAAYLPSVAISSPANGSGTSSASAMVSGTASDANGLSSLTVDGSPVTVAANGTWSTTIPLAKGANTITAVATNVFGNTAQAQSTVTYTPVVAPPAPAISHLSQSHRTWREKGKAGKHKPPVGTTFSFTLNEPAKVTLAFTERVSGRKVKKNKCVVKTHANRRKPTCKLTVKVGTLTMNGKTGQNKVAFKGAVAHGHKLAPGTYTLTITAVNSTTHVSSKPVSLKFTIVK